MVSPSSPWNCSISSREQELGSGRKSTADKEAFAMASSAAGGAMTGSQALMLAVSLWRSFIRDCRARERSA